MATKATSPSSVKSRTTAPAPAPASGISLSRNAIVIGSLLALTSIVLAMRAPSFLSPAFLLASLPVFANNSGGPAPTGGISGSTDGLVPYTIKTDGISATFIGYGARLTHLFVKDKNGKDRDIVVGYDSPARYVQDTETDRTYFGAIVGRFANRIKNGTFAIDNVDYHVENNEHNGLNALHGGTLGYDARNWTMVQSNATSITFSLFDHSGQDGFPGTVVTYVTYVVSSPARLTSRIVSISLDQKTPIMLANHVYWNLGSYTQATVLNDTLHLPFAKRVIGTDGIQIPDGSLQSVIYPKQSPPAPLNFTSPKKIGDGSLYSQQCGTGCTGIDNAFILDRPYDFASQQSIDPYVLKWHSADTGIAMTLRTNMGGIQIYDCVGQKGNIPVKDGQKQNGVQFVEKYGCLVMETQQWIDGINQPQWGVTDQEVYGPEDAPAINFSTYDFTVE